MTHRFLTEPEVAEILLCSRQKVQRLRLSGRLAYLPGRPVLIAQTDLDAFIAENSRLASSTGKREKKSDTSSSAEDARKWAMQVVLLKRKGKRASAKP
ncbi:excisionase family DNA binding protein [Agrobacterium tumefaciens]|uniref:helix-turn-helix domain-containing protein n=1 Tax=Agrobacterium tumefaciens TaxID=358 RepID=UPI000DD7C3D6|nr:helix-turn-helix domain-containing protein [Agrobacterium tumefaciens]MBP2569019.1 excisionase family DNA binding protein [Agrobacterium tumefaciens]